ncbi:MAG: hypothetical protein AABZ06_03150 [Bdellovibrionota bacterium]
MRMVSILLVTVLVISSGCGGSVTFIDYVETDTYISSADQSSHADDQILRISKSQSIEERAIVKLPTGKRDRNSHIENLLSDPISSLLIPFLIIPAILLDIFNCGDATLAPDNLTSAKLILSVVESSESGLTGKVELLLLEKPWWHTANWDRAHYFSSKGKWSQSGGDFDPTFTALTSSEASGEMEFDITNYFKTLILQQETAHFGFVLRSGASSLSPVSLASTQYSISSKGPRLESTYACVSRTSSYVRSTYYLRSMVEQ